MNLERARYYQENMDRLMQTDRLFLKNPVLVTGLGLAPIVVAATTLNNALILGLGVALLLTPTRLLAAVCCSRKVPVQLRGLVYTLCAAVLYIPIFFLLYQVFGVSLSAVGLYLPVLVVEPIIIKRYERPQPEPLGFALRKGITTTAGFLLALFVVAALREWLGLGTLLGYQLLAQAPMPLANYTSGGFICVGLLAALWRWMGNLFKKYVNLEAKQEV
ncbi:MAG: electron transporter RnfE [Pygmaiobacter massiliensis]|nr:electron transporter RnfE [Pygmaiobacter massiliensis]